MEQVLPAAHFAVGAEQIHEEIGPLVDVGFAREQAVDQLVALAGIRIRHKRAYFIGRGNTPGKIEHHAAQKFVIGRKWRVRHTVAAHLAENFLVDEIAKGQGIGGDRGSFRGRQLLGQRTCFIGLGRTKQRSMRLGKTIRGHGFLAHCRWLGGLPAVVSREHSDAKAYQTGGGAKKGPHNRSICRRSQPLAPVASEYDTRLFSLSIWRRASESQPPRQASHISSPNRSSLGRWPSLYC